MHTADSHYGLPAGPTDSPSLITGSTHLEQIGSITIASGDSTAKNTGDVSIKSRDVKGHWLRRKALVGKQATVIGVQVALSPLPLPTAGAVPRMPKLETSQCRPGTRLEERPAACCSILVLRIW